MIYNISQKKEPDKHPCFNIESSKKYARVHLPVAPACNIQCNFCNRKYDCVNESRPGVTSSVLDSDTAVEYLQKLSKYIGNISVVGIAGPGDPFANEKEVLDTFRKVNRVMPDKIFCLSTNGLNLYPYIDEISELGVSHVTITINATDPTIGAKIYSWIKFENHIYKGEEAARILLSRQLACIPKLKEKGIIVKINTIILPGINDHHIPEVARVTKELGADIMNCIPLLPTKGTPFENLTAPDNEMILRVRKESMKYLPMMTHCARCRADAAGLLGHDLKESYEIMREVLNHQSSLKSRPYVAAVSYEGILVNQHLAEAKSVCIFEKSNDKFKYIGKREMPPAGGRNKRWLEMVELLKDCRAILVGGIGPTPEKFLEKSGIEIIQMTGMISEGLDGVYNHKPIRSIKKSERISCNTGCSGDGTGCD